MVQREVSFHLRR